MYQCLHILFFSYILPIYHLKDLRQIYIFLGCNLLSSTAATNSSSVSSIGKKAACYVSNNLLLYYPKTRPKSLLFLAKKSFYIDTTDVENEFLNLNVRIIFLFLLLLTRAFLFQILFTNCNFPKHFDKQFCQINIFNILLSFQNNHQTESDRKKISMNHCCLCTYDIFLMQMP